MGEERREKFKRHTVDGTGDVEWRATERALGRV